MASSFKSLGAKVTKLSSWTSGLIWLLVNLISQLDIFSLARLEILRNKESEVSESKMGIDALKSSALHPFL